MSIYSLNAGGAKETIFATLLCIVRKSVSDAVDVQDFVSFGGGEECKESGNMGEARGGRLL